MGIPSKWNLRFGELPPGPKNLITDVAGVTVGHCTLAEGAIQTGVTAILPHPGNLFRDKVMAASHVINGFGKSVGLVQVDELGTLETPILLTNTLSVGTVSTALIRYMLAQNPEIGETTGTVNPVVCECNDGGLNDIRGLHVSEANALEALAEASVDFAEGAVGAGRGMRCHSLKGGIGSASRQVKLCEQSYTVGVLVLTNHALYKDLRIASMMPKTLAQTEIPETEDKGSVITIIATDAPFTERQLKRLCKRAVVGLSRTGSYIGNGSGEIALAFTTANRIPHFPEKPRMSFEMIHDDSITPFFRAVAEAVEEAVLSSLFHAETVTGKNGKRVPCLRELLEDLKAGVEPVF